MPGIFKNMASKPDEKEEAIALEIQSDTLLILSGLCEHYIERKVCDSCEPTFQVSQSPNGLHPLRSPWMVSFFLIL